MSNRRAWIGSISSSKNISTASLGLPSVEPCAGTMPSSTGGVRCTVFASATDAVTIEFEAKKAEDEKVDSIVDLLFSAIVAKFKPVEPDKPKDEPKPKAANDNFDAAGFATDIQTAFSAVLTAALKPIMETQTAHQRDFATLKTQLANTEQSGFSRSPASGGGDDAVTDC